MVKKLKCTKCKKLLPLSKFSKNKNTKTGYMSWCKDCKAKYDTNRRQEFRVADKCIRCCANVSLGKTRCKKHLKEQADDSKRARKRRRKKGLCIRCANKTRPGKAYCSQCAIKETERHMKRYEKRIQQKICVRCGFQKAVLNKIHCIKCLKVVNKRGKTYGRELKMKILQAYGKVCSCCGESHFEFLSMHHINNDGKKHREELGSTSLYHWLEKQNFPPGFSILCMNCHLAITWYSYCPHQIPKHTKIRGGAYAYPR